MGLIAALETERGETIRRVEDTANLLHRLLPSAPARDWQVLGYIDWYGDTVFNYLQMEAFLEEWRRLYGLAGTPEEVDLVRQIEELAETCRSGRHLYLKFYGD